MVICAMNQHTFAEEANVVKLNSTFAWLLSENLPSGVQRGAAIMKRQIPILGLGGYGGTRGSWKGH